MPFKSDKQRKWMWANDPEMAKKWAKEEQKEAVQVNVDKVLKNSKIKKLMKRLGIKADKSKESALKILNYLARNPHALAAIKVAFESVNELKKMTPIQKIEKLAKANKYGEVDGMRLNGKTANTIMKVYNHPKIKQFHRKLDSFKSHEIIDVLLNLTKVLGIKEDRDYKAEYKKYGSSTKSKKYRAELNQYNRKKGTYGNNDGKDASHKGGKIAGFEKESVNRGRAEKSRLKKEAILKLRQMIREELYNSQGEQTDFKKGDLVKDINPGCPHVGSEGEVTKVGNGTITFKVTNNGKTYQEDDVLEKTVDQMVKLSHMLERSGDYGWDWKNLTVKKGKTVKVTHKKSGKSLIIIDKPNVKREYEKIGYFTESVNETIELKKIDNPRYKARLHQVKVAFRLAKVKLTNIKPIKARKGVVPKGHYDKSGDTLAAAWAITATDGKNTKSGELVFQDGSDRGFWIDKDYMGLNVNNKKRIPRNIQRWMIGKKAHYFKGVDESVNEAGGVVTARIQQKPRGYWAVFNKKGESQFEGNKRFMMRILKKASTLSPNAIGSILDRARPGAKHLEFKAQFSRYYYNETVEEMLNPPNYLDNQAPTPVNSPEDENLVNRGKRNKKSGQPKFGTFRNESVNEAVKDPKLKVGQKIRHKSDPRRLYKLKKITHGNSGIPEDPAGTSYMFVAPGNRKEYHTKKTWAQAIKKGWIIPESVNEKMESVKEELLSENPAASAAAAMVMMQMQNPDTGKKVKAITPLKDKDHKLHGKAKGIFKRLKDKFTKKDDKPVDKVAQYRALMQKQQDFRRESVNEKISKEEWAEYPKWARKLKPYMRRLLKIPVKVRVIKQANHNPWIEVRVARFGKDVIPNDFRKRALKAIGGGRPRDMDNIHYGNITAGSVSLKHDQWVKMLGNKVR